MKDIIQNYFRDEATDKEKLSLLKYIRKPEGYEYFRSVEKEWVNSINKNENDGNFKCNFDKFQSYLLDNQVSKNNKLIRYNLFYKYASIIILFLFISFVGYVIFNKTNNLTTTIFADKGNVSSVILPDSTIVWLNSESKLSHTTEYGKNTRSVDLKGQAYFKVAKNQDKPFIVNVRDFRVKVLGTTFTVKSYPEDKESSIVLEEGEVELEDIFNNDKIIMHPGDRIICDANHVLHKQKINNSKIYSAWHNGRDMFYNAPLKDVVKELSRRYDCNIVLNEQFNDTRVTFYAEKGELKESLDIIKSIIPVEIISNNNIIFVK